ncbi:Rhodocoxin reductase [Mycobacterium innocens]|uniref:Rhodocoxin reductase n=1 Tax=Mycobacterium innocens TaxID=2341083 RepID=A0A498Q6C9_9MYCO|nr:MULTISPECIES: FAD-dependent oxidoreductase [Mycobacterium]VBA39945.1 Rhodocoxin reductase [Mycobacterium innocens]
MTTTVAESRQRPGRVVIVGASLAGLRAAEALRNNGFRGKLTLIGEEPYEPYDRPPLSKQVLTGYTPADQTALPRLCQLDAEWRLGVAAVGLDLAAQRVHLADGQKVGFDRLLIATGARARPWPNQAEAALDGVGVLRTRDDATRLRRYLAAKPRRVLTIGAGFIGSEIASVCRELDLPVTVVDRGGAPLENALGGVIGDVATTLQRQHGVDLRCGVTVTELEGDGNGRLRRAHLSDGTTLDVEVAVAALGSLRNTEWLHDSGLAADGNWGVACDAACRAFGLNGIVTDNVFVAGDVARFPHPLYDFEFLGVEHWSHAVAQAEVAAHNMACAPAQCRPHLAVPTFWSAQFGVNIKSVGVPRLADEVVVSQGSVDKHRFVAAYGRKGRLVAAVTFNQGMWLDFFEQLIAESAPFPSVAPGFDQPADAQPVPARFPTRGLPSHGPDVILTGHTASERGATFASPRQRANQSWTFPEQTESEAS